MPPRRPKPTAASKARAARIAAALEGLLEEVPEAADYGSPNPSPTDDGASPYRGMPDAPAATSQSRVGLDCPGCEAPMELATEKGVPVHRCITCSGLWLDPGELEAMVDDHGPAQADVSRLREGMKQVAVPKQPVLYRKCPRCKDVMHRRNYGSHSGVVVDECRRHGLYLDPGEFEAIEAFIALGGLSLERVNERRKLQADRRRAETAEAYARTSHGTVRHYPETRWTNLMSWIFG